MRIPFVHRKRECDRTHQGLNWNSDGYTLFQLWIHIWRLRFMFRIRRKKEFGEFTKTCPRWYTGFDIQGVYKLGFLRLNKNLWENFDSDMYVANNVLYRIEELPEEHKIWIAKNFPY